MGKRVLGLDVGSYSVKAVIMEGRGRPFSVQALSFDEQLLNLPPDQMHDGEPLWAAQQAALETLRARGSLDYDVCTTVLPGQAAQVRWLDMPFTDVKKIEAVLPGELESQTPFDLDELMVSWYAEAKAQPGKLAVAFAQKTAIARYLESLKQASVDPRLLNVKPYGLFDISKAAFPAFVQSKDPVLVMTIDIGHAFTNICVWKHNHCVLARVLLRGGLDVTRALMQHHGLSAEDAQRVKHGLAEGDSQELKTAHVALTPLVRELRQTIFAVQNTLRFPVTQILLCGGASRLAGLENVLREQLHVNVISHQAWVLEPDRVLSPESVLAVGCAMNGILPLRKTDQFNFRKGEFVYRGETGGLGLSGSKLGIWALVILLLLVTMGITKCVVSVKEVKLLKVEEQAACDQVLGQKNVDPALCVKQIKEKIQKAANSPIPAKDAVDDYIEISRLIPPHMDVKISGLEITESNIHLIANTSSLEMVEQVVADLQKGRCFSKVEKGPTRQITGGLEFELSIDINCKE